MSDTALEFDIPIPRERQRRGRTRLIHVLAPLGVAACLIGIWALWVRLSGISPLLLPQPWDVGKNMISSHELIVPQIWTTVKSVLVGFAWAAGAGLLFAILIAAFRPIELTIYPILVGSQVIPKIALAPIILLVFGLGNTSRIIIIVSLAFFPIVICTVVGLNSVEPNMINLSRSLGAGEVKTFVKFRIPHALPDMFAGMKLAATRAVGAALIAEFITPGNKGLGRLILTTTTELRPDISLACIGYLIILGVTLFLIVSSAERLLIPWHVSVRRRS